MPWILPDNGEWGPYRVIFQAKSLPKSARACSESFWKKTKKFSRPYYIPSKWVLKSYLALPHSSAQMRQVWQTSLLTSSFWELVTLKQFWISVPQDSCLFEGAIPSSISLPAVLQDAYIATHSNIFQYMHTCGEDTMWILTKSLQLALSAHVLAAVHVSSKTCEASHCCNRSWAREDAQHMDSNRWGCPGSVVAVFQTDDYKLNIVKLAAILKLLIYLIYNFHSFAKTFSTELKCRSSKSPEMISQDWSWTQRYGVTKVPSIPSSIPSQTRWRASTQFIFCLSTGMV